MFHIIFAQELIGIINKEINMHIILLHKIYKLLCRNYIFNVYACVASFREVTGHGGSFKKEAATVL